MPYRTVAWIDVGQVADLLFVSVFKELNALGLPKNGNLGPTIDVPAPVQ
jgi:hypothetical protein